MAETGSGSWTLAWIWYQASWFMLLQQRMQGCEPHGGASAGTLSMSARWWWWARAAGPTGLDRPVHTAYMQDQHAWCAGTSCLSEQAQRSATRVVTSHHRGMCAIDALWSRGRTSGWQ